MQYRQFSGTFWRTRRALKSLRHEHASKFSGYLISSESLKSYLEAESIRTWVRCSQRFWSAIWNAPLFSSHFGTFTACCVACSCCLCLICLSEIVLELSFQAICPDHRMSPSAGGGKPDHLTGSDLLPAPQSGF